MSRIAAGALFVLALTALGATPLGPSGYRLAVAPYRFAFPRDHAAHPDYRTEWWYYTGHLTGGRRRFGYELTFFRVGVSRAWERSPSQWAPREILFAHLALTDEDHGTFRHFETASRPALGLAGADTARYHVWIDEWSAELAPDGHAHRLRASVPELGLSLDLVPLKPEVVHGDSGVSRKGAGLGHASHYVSLTRLATRGTLSLPEGELAVTGESWMDHEFASDALAPEVIGWDWFSVQLADDRELMLYRLRHADGSSDSASSGTWVVGGRTKHVTSRAFSIIARSQWKSPHSGASYPAGWELRVPGEGLVLSLTPTVPDQELTTGGRAGVVYWEGSVRITGHDAKGPVHGVGYVELTGYGGPPLGL